MIITYDLEFVDDGCTVEPLSLGMVAENGDELYRIFEDGPWRVALNNAWMRNNVLDKLPITYVWRSDSQRGEWGWNREHEDFAAVMPRDHIAADVERFLWDHAIGLDKDHELASLWADHPATDHVALYQLFGPMIECTKHGMPMRTSCVAQEEDARLREQRRALWGLGEGIDPGPMAERNLISALGEKPGQDEATKHHALHDARHDMALVRWLGVDR